MPSWSGACAISFAVWLASDGYRTVLPWTAHHRQVLERHLGRPVLADRDASMRAAQVHVRAADRRHPDEVVGAREEGRERRRERLPLPHLGAHGGCDQLLLRDVHLEVALRERVGELLRVRRVAHLAVHGHHVAAGGAERLERVAVRLSRRRVLPSSYTGSSSSPDVSNTCGVPVLTGLRTSTVRLRSPPSSSTALSGSSSALPCHPFLFSTRATPLPLIVCATITEGGPSWPSHPRRPDRSRRGCVRRSGRHAIRTHARAPCRRKDPSRASSRRAARAG